MWTGAILAGGRARRLGERDKGALRVGASSILERQLAVLRALTPHILIVGHPRSVADDRVRLVQDRLPGAGALGGLYTALVEASTEQVLVIACDMPFVSAPFLAALARFGADVDAAVPRDSRGRHPLCASYQRRLADRLKARIDAGALRISEALLECHVLDIGPAEIAPYDPHGRLLTNVNTRDDYQRALLAVDREPPSA